MSTWACSLALDLADVQGPADRAQLRWGRLGRAAPSGRWGPALFHTHFSSHSECQAGWGASSSWHRSAGKIPRGPLRFKFGSGSTHLTCTYLLCWGEGGTSSRQGPSASPPALPTEPTLSPAVRASAKPGCPGKGPRSGLAPHGWFPPWAPPSPL